MRSVVAFLRLHERSPDPRTLGLRRYGRRMAEQFKKGDEVSWSSHGNTVEGEVEKRITSDTKAGGRQVRASGDDPQYLVKSEKSGGEAVHKPEALEKE